MKITNVLVICSLCVVSSPLTFAQEIKINQLKENTYVLAVSPEALSSGRIEWSNKPDHWTGAILLALSGQSDTVVLASAHPILKLSESKKKIEYTAPRAIVLQGAVNFRDLGGYKTNDGRQVKWGKIYRSADIGKLTDADLNILASLNLKMVCDFRGPMEVQASPDRLPAGTDRISLPAGSETIGGANGFARYMKNEHAADSMILSVYTNSTHFKEKYKPMFDQLLTLEEDKALMFHCTAGKDRTGVGAALILYALGVNESDIYADYEATNEYRKPYNDASIKAMGAQGISESAAKIMMAADPRYLKACFASLTADYGSVDKFLEQQMELTGKKRAELKKKFLY